MKIFIIILLISFTISLFCNIYFFLQLSKNAKEELEFMGACCAPPLDSLILSIISYWVILFLLIYGGYFLYKIIF
jgi:glucan phosphoethanolaminetransferase (alkaline phosphatase superfamily)